MVTEFSSERPLGVDATKPGPVFMNVLRLIFVLVLWGVGWSMAADERIVGGELGGHGDLFVIGCIGIALIVIALDLFLPRKSLGAVSALFFGLVVGIVMAYGLSLILQFVVQAIVPGGHLSDSAVSVVDGVKLGLGVICCYLTASFILQTKDDVRFVIPYVEFAKETKGAKPFILDTSVIVDGRIADIAATGVLATDLIVPRFILQELQTIADSSDKLKRTRGRRGLDMLNKLQSNERIDIRILEVKPERSAADAGADEMLVDLARQLAGKLVTNDYNLNKVAQLRGVVVININDLANALKPVVLPGESLSVKMIKPGEEAGQGIGYLEDGTMVVAEGGRERVGEQVALTVTSVLQTSAGRMIFGRVDGIAATDRRRT
ncbi:MAG: PIN/TRAM domain-containing protein [Planctomycetes bacterium]|nr:PIN/TRAM domain-containing protein [Planctomycetota bacterium]